LVAFESQVTFTEHDHRAQWNAKCILARTPIRSSARIFIRRALVAVQHEWARPSGTFNKANQQLARPQLDRAWKPKAPAPRYPRPMMTRFMGFLEYSVHGAEIFNRKAERALSAGCPQTRMQPNASAQCARALLQREQVEVTVEQYRRLPGVWKLGQRCH